MGLKDIEGVDDNASSSSSRSRGGSSKQEDDGPFISFSCKQGEKAFTEERWDEIRTIISQEMEHTVGEVKTMPAEKRHKVLHEAATWTDDGPDEDSDLYSHDRCALCGNSLSAGFAEFEGEAFCIQHTAGQLATYFMEETKKEIGARLEY